LACFFVGLFMPRISSEARSGAAFRAGGGSAPKPPKHLSDAAKAIWQEVAASKPVDWFDPGACVLLESYCELGAHARVVHARLVKLREAEAWDDCKAWEKRAGLLAEKLSTLATKLRLSVQAQVDRHSRKITEKGAGETAGDPLIGGAAVWGDRASVN
jgi:hypothetical protein